MDKVTTSSRRTVARVKRHKVQEEICFEPCPTEIDNHADTICFGSNFRPVYFTSEVCHVSPFLPEYEEQTDVRICTAVTAVELDTGETVMLQFGQGLWFGNRMDRTLLNPNQCRSYGVDVCDNPTDPHRPLGIQVSDDCFVPMKMFGSTCGFISRCPSDDEMDGPFRWFTLSDETHWDPTSVTFPTVHRNVASVVGGKVSTMVSSTALVREICNNVQIDSIAATYSNKRHHGTDPHLLARKWGIGIKTAKDTLSCTTQHNIRSAVLPLTRRYRTDLLSQRLKRLSCRFYTDTAFAKEKSLVGNTCTQIFTDGKGFIVAFPMRSKEDAGDGLQKLCMDVGIPDQLHSDNAYEMVQHGTKFQEVVRDNKIKYTTIEPHSPWQNRCENIIGVINKRAKARRARRRVPMKLWDFGLVWECEIYSRIANKESGRTGLERLTGDSVDISDWIDFEFYDLIWYWDTRDVESKRSIGRWLGVSHNVGSALCYWVITDKGTILSRTTVQHLTSDEIKQPDIKSQVHQFHENLDKILGDDQYTSDDLDIDFVHDDVKATVGYDEVNEGNYMGLEESPELDDVVDNSDDRSMADTYDRYVGAEVAMPDRNGQKIMAKVMKKVITDNANKSNHNYNPLNDHSVYEVQFTDGSTEELTANVIAENMLSSCDSEGRHYQLISEIIDHNRSSDAIRISDGYIRSKGGNKVPKKTTRGWKLLVEWKDGSVDWIPLKDLKQSNPIELAEYAFANGIEEEPAFKWWAKVTLRKRDRIISKVKTKYWRTSHKFGIRVPKTVEEAIRIDKETGTDHWTKAIAKEMKNVRIAFDKLENITVEEMRSGKVRPGYSFCGTHMVFDIKMDGMFTRKARLVADGHKTSAPTSITYSSVVSRDSVRLAFMIASLNNLNVFACDIGNAYLNAKCREKLWTIAGTEFGSEKGSVMIIARALYGLKSSGAAWRAKLADTLRDIGYRPSEADPDVWIKKEIQPNGTINWKYMLVYVDDILHVAHDPKHDMDLLSETYRLKDGTGPPSRYLGANVEKVQLCDGSTSWSMTCVDYLRGAIENVNNMLKEQGSALKNVGDGKRPYPSSYRPELDVTNELNDQLANRFQQLIGILRWSIELGRLDIYTEVSCLSQHLCNPREGHLLAAYKVFRYLQVCMKKNPGRLVFDGKPTFTDERLFDSSVTDPREWADFYPDACEAKPGKTVEPLGNPVRIRAYVDANHAGNLANRRSHSGILIYANNAPIIWYSKRQNTVETSSFGSEYVALRICTELIEALRYKLRTFGIPIDGAAEVFCDNKSVVTNSSVPSSVLNKRHNAICYHRVREAQAAGTIRVGWIEGKYNLADLFTKTTMSGNERHGMVENIFHNNAAPLIDEDTKDTT